jgi:molecular chaperone GrpE
MKEKNPENSIEDIVLEESDLDDSVVAEENQAESIKKLREKLKKCEAEKQEYLTGWQRAKADLINARKRDEEDRKEFLKFSNERLIESIIPVMESFDMAMGNKEAWEKVDKNWRMGVEYIHQQLMKVLSENGVSEIPVQSGDVFDPKLHEPFGNTETDDAALEHKIEKVIQKGYKAGDKIIRPARVAVWVGK